MKLKTLIGAAGATAVLLTAHAATAHDADHHKGPKVEKSYDYTGFDRIYIEGVYSVDIRVGPDFSIDTSGSEKRMKYAKVSQSGDTLILGLKDGLSGKAWRGKNNGIKAVITLPSLHEVSLKGVGSVDARGIKSKSFDVSLEGVGSVELSGTCDSLKASVEGVGSLEADNLECKEVDVSVEGMGSAEVYASESVDADIEGIGSIEVDGAPATVKKSKSFLSSIEVH